MTARFQKSYQADATGLFGKLTIFNTRGLACVIRYVPYINSSHSQKEFTVGGCSVVR
jgi:hypothetical protein